MSNRFLFPATDADARRILAARREAIRLVGQGFGNQNELTGESHPSAIAATRRIRPVTTDTERKMALAYAIANGFLMASIPVTERAHEIAKGIATEEIR